MLAHANRCAVCGWRGDGDVCPQCGTVLLRGRALCRRCGKMFDGPIARCDACGGDVRPPPTAREEAAIARLTHLPGIDETAAKKLQARGFEDPADVFRLALPDRAVRLGVHRSLARKVTLGELRIAPKLHKTRLCPTCGAPREAKANRCGACGSEWDRVPDPDQVRRSIDEIVGEVYDLMADADFRRLPEEMQEEILDTFEAEGLPTVDATYANQFREWQLRGFDTRELERILHDEGSEAFKGKFVAIIRSQLMKRRTDGRFECPICDTVVAANDAECEYCGAKFR